MTTGSNEVTGASPNQGDITGFLVLPTTVTKLDKQSLFNLQSLNGVYIPKTVTTFNKSVWYLKALKNIYVDPASTSFKTINGALYSYDGKTLYLAPRGITGSFSIESGCTKINGCAFQHTSYSSITIPDSVTIIDSGAFRDMPNLTSLNISKYVTMLISPAVGDANLTTVNIDGDNPNYTTADGVIYSKDMTTLIMVPAGKTGEFIIPSTVTLIKNDACTGCRKLTKITIPESVIDIGPWAFSGCSSLKSINIPSKITRINEGTFSNVSTPITIPANVTKISNRNFTTSSSIAFADTSHQWKLSLTSGGAAVSGVPTEAFDVSTPSENAAKFRKYIYYIWTRQ